jgi:hypothetical protein
MISLVQGCIQEVFRTQGQKVKNMLEARVQSGKKTANNIQSEDSGLFILRRYRGSHLFSFK